MAEICFKFEYRRSVIRVAAVGGKQILGTGTGICRHTSPADVKEQRDGLPFPDEALSVQLYLLSRCDTKQILVHRLINN
jgi:hypothetical protein